MSTPTAPASQFDLAEAGDTQGLGQAASDYWTRVKGGDLGSPLAIIACLVAGVAIGFAIALLVARLGIPSFVVTLAFFLGLQGAMLLIIGEGGTIPIRSDAVLAVMNKNMPVALGWLLALIVIGGFAAATL